jgi:uncharacterized protein YoxC
VGNIVDLTFCLFIASVVLLAVVVCAIREVKRKFDEVENILRAIVEQLEIEDLREEQIREKASGQGD